MAEAEIRIAPHHDPLAYAAEFARRGRLHIAGFLDEGDAKRIHDALLKRTSWNLTILHDGARDVTPAQWDALTPQQKAKFEFEVIEAARRRFEGRYCTVRLSDNGEAFTGDVPELVALSRFLNDEPYLSFMRVVTGMPAIALTDAQATLYNPGDFLLEHDDANTPRKHLAAYVLNLTPRWRPEWGGLLSFIDPQGGVEETFTPSWNAINLLKVPQPHYVSFVAPYASAGRFSVTGWMRAR